MHPRQIAVLALAKFLCVSDNSLELCLIQNCNNVNGDGPATSAWGQQATILTRRQLPLREQRDTLHAASHTRPLGMQATYPSASKMMLPGLTL
jgi:hypothetical protein